MTGKLALIDRRQVLKACGIAPIAFASPSRGGGQTGHFPIIIYDGREEISCLYAAAQSCPTIDLVVEQASGWRGIRALKAVTGVNGLTRWGEFLLVRSFFEEHGLRVQSCSSRVNGFSLWNMT